MMRQQEKTKILRRNMYIQVFLAIVYTTVYTACVTQYLYSSIHYKSQSGTPMELFLGVFTVHQRSHCEEGEPDCREVWSPSYLIFAYSKPQNNDYCTDGWNGAQECYDSFIRYASWSVSMGVIMSLQLVIGMLTVCKIVSLLRANTFTCVVKCKASPLMLTQFVMSLVPFVSFPIFKYTSEYMRAIEPRVMFWISLSACLVQGVSLVYYRFLKSRIRNQYLMTQMLMQQQEIMNQNSVFRDN